MLLRHAGTTSHGGVTQTKWPPTNPGRFNPSSVIFNNMRKASNRPPMVKCPRLVRHDKHEQPVVPDNPLPFFEGAKRISDVLDRMGGENEIIRPRCYAAQICCIANELATWIAPFVESEC